MVSSTRSSDLSEDGPCVPERALTQIPCIQEDRAGIDSTAAGVRVCIVNQLLTKIDGVEALNNVLLIRMTNRKDMLDEALLRSYNTSGRENMKVTMEDFIRAVCEVKPAFETTPVDLEMCRLSTNAAASNYLWYSRPASIGRIFRYFDRKSYGNNPLFCLNISGFQWKSEYLQGNPLWLQYVKVPLVTLGYENSYDVFVKAHGGGLSGQAQAITLGVARALLKVSADHRSPLKKEGLLTRDARVVERKKVGLKKARKAPQFSKR
ncbi:unnamed protein product [Arabis nemorensis]|uniref:ATPase AAA-type core domain-containing protein n=1 Tax=Arabis nemorensis TaxID=586526 RepID=A0A565B2I2_9BRAS|nr:unnamed protein product [Arabis nemorensis]